MKLFILTEHCKSQVHCDLCRMKNKGRKWRENLSVHCTLPENKIDFECPYNKPWINDPELPTSQNISSPKPKTQSSQPILRSAGTRGGKGGCGCGR